MTATRHDRGLPLGHPGGREFCIGIDDTDVVGSPGTNQLARHLAGSLPDGCTFVLSLRHQLLVDPRVPFTSGNGSASLLVRASPDVGVADLSAALVPQVRAWYVEGSDPGLCITCSPSARLREFGERCQRALVTLDGARAVAHDEGAWLQSLGGTGGGAIGALAAVGLLGGGEDGRVVHLAGWPWPDPFAHGQPVADVLARGVDEVRDLATGQRVTAGTVDVGKHLRPAWRGRRVVLFVEGDGEGHWRARKLP